MEKNQKALLHFIEVGNISGFTEKKKSLFSFLIFAFLIGIILFLLVSEFLEWASKFPKTSYPSSATKSSSIPAHTIKIIRVFPSGPPKFPPIKIEIRKNFFHSTSNSAKVEQILRFSNDDKVMHHLRLELNGKFHSYIKIPASVKKEDFFLFRAGKYHFFCNIPSHSCNSIYFDVIP